MVQNYSKKYKTQKTRKSAWISLSLCLITALNSSCALALGRGRVVCDPPALPSRPDSEICLYNGDGTSSCFDPRQSPQKYVRKLNIGDISVNPGDYNEQDKWVESVLRACR